MEPYKLTCYDEQASYRIYHGTGQADALNETAHLHYDESLTLSYFIACSGTIRIEGHTYNISTGDIIIINANELHCRTIEKNSFLELIAIHINDSILHSFPFEAPDLFDAFRAREYGVGNLIPARVVAQTGLDLLVKEILACAKESGGAARILTTCKLTELLARLNRLPIPRPNSAGADKTGIPIMDQVLRYINAHFQEELSCPQIAAHFFIGKHRLEHMFKDSVGIPLWEYVIMKRLLFFNDLVKKDVPINEAAYAAGFHNYANFFRLYKKHMNISPLEYKKRLTTR